ncbi:MAG: outer membrane lipoprotein-sorting protein [Candidatus Marinimicrobia bacterium]|nr:outer membrane lipoprotein-sorting protein [Candidatus Neomarinimicrobiota bacterium]
MKQIFNLSAPLLVAVSLLVAGAAPDSSAVEMLTRIARRVEGIDHSATLTIEKFSRGKLTATQRMDFFVRYPAADSVIMQTAIELLPGSRGAGQKFWLWQLTHDRKRQWLYSPGSDKLREITRRRVGGMALFDLDDLALTEADIVGMEHAMGAPDPGSGWIEIRSSAIGKPRRKIKGKRVAETRLWIDPEHNLVRKSQSFSTKGNLIQTVEVEATEMAGGILWATEVKITLARKQELTRITMTNLSVRPLTDDALFMPVRP